MEEQLVSFETAVLAKEKGFSESCIYYYNKDCILESFKHCPDYDECNDGGGFVSINEILMSCDYDMLLAPTQSLLQQWLREKSGRKFHFQIYPCLNTENAWDCNIYVTDDNFKTTGAACSISAKKSYEEALEISLMKALNLINTK